MQYELMTRDTWPPLRATLEDERGPIGLVNAAVEFHMIPAPESGKVEPVIEGECVIVDEERGIVEYPWVAGDTDVAGVYRAQFIVLLGPGTPGERREAFPSDEPIEVIIRESVAP